MRKPRAFPRVAAAALAALIAFSAPLSAAAAVVAAPEIIPAEISGVSGAAPAFAAVSFTAAPLVAPPVMAAPSALAAPALSLSAALPAALPAASAPAAPVARALGAAALQSAALTAASVPADGAKAAAGRSFDLSAARPADRADAVAGEETSRSAPLAPAAVRTGALKSFPRIPAAAPRLAARAKSYAPKILLAAGAFVAAFALHHFGVSPAGVAAPFALLAGTLGRAAWTPSPAVLDGFLAQAAAAAPAGHVLGYEEASRIAGRLSLDESQANEVLSALMARGDLGITDNRTILHFDFAARARAVAEPATAEQLGDRAAADAVRLLNSGAALDHAKGLAEAAAALNFYDRSEHETGVRVERRKEAEVLRANLALEHLGDLLRLHQAGVEARRPADDPFRIARVADVAAALAWLKTAHYARGEIPTMPRDLHTKMLAILNDVTPRDENGGQPEELVTAYIETVDLLEKYDPSSLLDEPRPATPAQETASAFRDGILEDTRPGTPVKYEIVQSVAGKLSLSDEQARLQLTDMARDGWLALRASGVMIRTSLPARAAEAAANDPLRSAHRNALAGVKLFNSADRLDHLRAVARLDTASEGYFSVLRGRAEPDRVYEETQVLLGNAVLEAAADALRALQSRLIAEAPSAPDGDAVVENEEKLARVTRALELVDGAYYSADRRLETPEGSAEELRDLLDLRAFRDIVKDKINGDMEIVRGVRTVRAYLARAAAPPVAASTGYSEPDVPATPGGFRPLKASVYPTLLSFGTDLTQKAAAGALRPMIGRKAELRQMIKTLLRVEKNNPLVIGEKGVGKTAIVNGLAQLIAGGEIPELRGKNIVKIDLNKVVAGTGSRGMFEQRMQGIIDEARKSEGRVILFIDEIHMIVGAGDAEGATDASQILKESLSDGSLSLIGATTTDEFRRIEKDGALMRRFNPVKLAPPTKDEAVDIVAGVKSIYEQKHGVTIALETVKAAVSLAARYVTDRHLPDSALDLMDDASAEVELKASEAKAAGSENPTKAVAPEDIAREISMRTGVPAGKLTEDKKTALKNLPAEMKGQVIGQDEAVAAVAEAVQAGETGYRDPKQPIASFVFLGPTGVGKTELARALAKIKFGSEKNMLRLDMSEYQEKHSVSRLISAPPGYAGHDEGGQLTESIRRNPYQVILLDEIEKAHPDVFDVLLQVLEDGRLTDGQGRTVDFSNTIIIMTSNIGGSLAGEETEKKKNPIGFRLDRGEEKADAAPAADARKAKYVDEFKKKYRPEFVNRVGEDRVIVFNEISDRAKLGAILNLRLKALESQLKDKGLTVTLTDAAREAVLAKALAQSRYGARPIKQIVDREINAALKDAELEGRISDGDAVIVDWDADAGRYRAERTP